MPLGSQFQGDSGSGAGSGHPDRTLLLGLGWDCSGELGTTGLLQGAPRGSGPDRGGDCPSRWPSWPSSVLRDASRRRSA